MAFSNAPAATFPKTFPKAFDADPARSYTLPGFYYHEPAIFEREKEAIFYKTWQYVGHVSQLAEPGRYITRQIGNESIVVLRGKDRELHAFYNVCRHRAHRLLSGEGTVKSAITCPYHAWSYELDGRLHAARGSDKVAGFDKTEFCLTAVRAEDYCGFVFVNLDSEARPLKSQVDGLEADVRSFSPHPETLRLAHRRQYEIKANWKVVVENFSECYHCPPAHPSFSNGVTDLKSYRIEVTGLYHRHTSRAQSRERAAYSFDPGAARAGEYAGWLIWPNVAIEVFPGSNLNIFHVTPTGPEGTLQTVEWFFEGGAPSREEQEIIDYMHDTVRLEDVAIVESVQQGLKSRGYRQGRFVVDAERTDISEHGVHDFQRRVLEALSG